MVEKDISFSESQIEYILRRAEAAWRQNKLRPHLEDDFLLTLEHYLRKQCEDTQESGLYKEAKRRAALLIKRVELDRVELEARRDLDHIT